jgi:murein DD-endopeptidase MepM/ murein hydrolase activator NlpD
MQTIFGFFDRRFPGYNNGLEHLGVDFSAAAGTAVTAICDGTVVFNNTSQSTIGSAVVMVEHDCPQPLGMVYGYYGHVQSILLTGESVAAGSNIGYIRDWGGNSHLHLGLSTRLYEADWGVVRGTTLQELEAQGWLNPLNFFAIAPRPAPIIVVQPVARPQPPVRTIVPLKSFSKPATSTVKLKRLR